MSRKFGLGHVGPLRAQKVMLAMPMEANNFWVYMKDEWLTKIKMWLMGHNVNLPYEDKTLMLSNRDVT